MSRLFVTSVVVGLMTIFAGACGMSDRVDKSRMMAEETMAIQALKVIQTAQVQYFSQYGAYAKSLNQLGPATSGPSSAQAAAVIPADLASGAKGGYKFMMDGDGKKFSIQARPAEYGKTGSRSFYSDDSLVIHQNTEDAPATAASPAMN